MTKSELLQRKEELELQWFEIMAEFWADKISDELEKRRKSCENEIDEVNSLLECYELSEQRDKGEI